MNRPILTLFLLLSFLSTRAQQPSIMDLRGCWDILDKQIPGAKLEIVDSSTIYLSLGEDRKKIISYTIDLSRTPAWFDFTIENSGKNIEVKSILQFFGESVMKWQLFINEDRATHFSAGRGGWMFLKRYREDPVVAIK